ncbi:hypothetical protein LWF15_00160 [Kineosporia rhizophila]|uniref:hypothetical protein n=1 Tax=Kineosporia rhizophila TaxID=84633 RepID=UPI001E4ECBCC|nr:hypothetical protein [Kineosporia rhizophila]MCE0533917.1 hypothetical protein [Kineosporia rhizophila]
MIEFLKAFDGYFPWLVLLGVCLLFRRAVLSVITAVAARVSARSGVAFTAQGTSLKLEEMVRNTGGCLVQMSTERQGPDRAWRTAEALQFVPAAAVVRNAGDGNWSLGQIAPMP